MILKCSLFTPTLEKMFSRELVREVRALSMSSLKRLLVAEPSPAGEQLPAFCPITAMDGRRVTGEVTSPESFLIRPRCRHRAISYLRCFSNMKMGPLFGFTQLSQMENNQLVLLLVRPWLQFLQHQHTNTQKPDTGTILHFCCKEKYPPPQSPFTWTRSKISACSLSVSWDRYFWMASFALGG